jgi:hypothetical protein
MKPLRFFLSLLLLILGLFPAWASGDSLFAQSHLPQIENQTFRRGEFLKFRIHYGFVTAGFVEMEVAEKAKYENGRRCYHIIGRGYSSPSFDVFYKLRDVYESFMDEEMLVSWRFNRSIKEGSFESYSETHFDHHQGQARYINFTKDQRQTYEVTAGIQDVISAFYYARTKYDTDALAVGDKISLRNFIDRKTVSLEARVLAKETIKIDGQHYQALKMDLLVEEAGMITDGSEIVFWISDDANKIPLRIESKLTIGSLKIDLIEYQNLVHPFTARLD